MWGKNKGAVREGLVALALLCCAGALIRWPREVSEAVREGLSLCGNVILPSLFPFFVLSSMAVSLGLAHWLGRLAAPLMGPVFHLGGPCAVPLVLGFIGGYPVGARAALTLYQEGGCGRRECERLLAFCNNSGPAFILGVVGAGVFADSRVGVLLCLIHALASLLVGLAFRSYRWERGERLGGTVPAGTVCSLPRAFTQAVTGAASSALRISAFVVTFTVLLRLAFLSGLLPALAGALSRLLAPLGFREEWGRSLIAGMIELSSGVWGLAGEGALRGRVAMAAFLLGWAGLSVHCQVLSFLGESGLSTGTYLGGKLLHGVLSALLTAAVFRVFPEALPAGRTLTEQVEGIAGVDFATALGLSAAAAWLLFLALFALAALGANLGGKRERGVI